MDRPPRILITGAPGSGKTTLIETVARRLGPARTAGFTTGEIREGGERVGFRVALIPDGRQAVLAHRSLRGLRVGRYGVDVPAFESLVLPFLEGPVDPGKVLLIDEIGNMECFSRRFQAAVETLLDGARVPILATVPLRASGFPVRVKARPDAQTVTVRPANREEALAEVVSALGF